MGEIKLMLLGYSRATAVSWGDRNHLVDSILFSMEGAFGTNGSCSHFRKKNVRLGLLVCSCFKAFPFVVKSSLRQKAANSSISFLVSEGAFGIPDYRLALPSPAAQAAAACLLWLCHGQKCSTRPLTLLLLHDSRLKPQAGVKKRS